MLGGKINSDTSSKMDENNIPSWFKGLSICFPTKSAT